MTANEIKKIGAFSTLGGQSCIKFLQNFASILLMVSKKTWSFHGWDRMKNLGKYFANVVKQNYKFSLFIRCHWHPDTADSV